MGWYDVFSRFYDRSLEPLYREQREEAADLLGVSEGDFVVDFPCGTGLGFEGLRRRVGEAGGVVGGDASHGMLHQAARKVRSAGWNNVHLFQADVRKLTVEHLAAAVGRPVKVDRLLVFLGLSAFPDWELAFERLWALLAPGGRCVIVDCHTERLGLQGHLVNLMARADLRRPTWRRLEGVAEDYRRGPLPSLPEHGGELFWAVGKKPMVPVPSPSPAQGRSE